MFDMLGRIMEKLTKVPSDMLGTIHDLLEKLVGKDGQWWLNALKKFLRKENPFAESTEPGNYFELREMWKKIYRKHFRMKVDFSNLRIPEKSEGDWWLIIVVGFIGPEIIFQACEKAFHSCKFTDNNLDKIVQPEHSNKEKVYAIWVRANVEADEQFKKLSAKQLKELGHGGIALEERMLLELMYFEQSGKHLDIQCRTLCSGSRYSDGDVPYVHWTGDKLHVSWNSPDYRSGNLRARQVVS